MAVLPQDQTRPVEAREEFKHVIGPPLSIHCIQMSYSVYVCTVYVSVYVKNHKKDVLSKALQPRLTHTTHTTHTHTCASTRALMHLPLLIPDR